MTNNIAIINLIELIICDIDNLYDEEIVAQILNSQDIISNQLYYIKNVSGITVTTNLCGLIYLEQEKGKPLPQLITQYLENNTPLFLENKKPLNILYLNLLANHNKFLQHNTLSDLNSNELKAYIKNYYSKNTTLQQSFNNKELFYATLEILSNHPDLVEKENYFIKILEHENFTKFALDLLSEKNNYIERIYGGKLINSLLEYSNKARKNKQFWRLFANKFGVKYIFDKKTDISFEQLTSFFFDKIAYRNTPNSKNEALLTNAMKKNISGMIDFDRNTIYKFKNLFCKEHIGSINIFLNFFSNNINDISNYYNEFKDDNDNKNLIINTLLNLQDVKTDFDIVGLTLKTMKLFNVNLESYHHILKNDVFYKNMCITLEKEIINNSLSKNNNKLSKHKI